jgi:hypothetical protein
LDLGVVAAEEEENRVESISCDRANFFLRYFSKSQCCTPLEINIVGEGKGSERLEGRAGEEIGRRSVWGICQFVAIKYRTTNRHTLEILQQICYCLSLVLKQQRLVCLRPPRLNWEGKK